MMKSIDDVFDAQEAVIDAALELAKTSAKWTVGGQLCWCECKREQGMLDGTKRHGYLCRRMNALRDAVAIMKATDTAYSSDFKPILDNEVNQ